MVLKGENQVRNITYYNAGDTSTPQTVDSYLKIREINGDGAVGDGVDGGSLYIPYKIETEAEIEAFVATKTNYNHWNAGIGGIDSQSLVQNLHIAGGKIQVVTTLGDNCTAIGAGGNGYCEMLISGGEVIAHCNGTGAAIGGGIGWNAAGGKSNVTITGGKVYAKNHSEIESGDELVGGVAIGSGSSFHAAGSEGIVTISGGYVEAYGTFGNGIGGGNSSTSVGGKATISITGGTVIASSIGGGDSKSGVGGSATVVVSGTADITLTKGIGGGKSSSGNGGAATITVESGTMNVAGSIGGGEGGGTGNGGDATVNIYGGNLTAASIGGGTGSVGGHGGAAIVKVTDGFIETGSIGGGKTNNPNGNLGYAKATISGGAISGQFLMAAGRCRNLHYSGRRYEFGCSQWFKGRFHGSGIWTYKLYVLPQPSGRHHKLHFEVHKSDVQLCLEVGCSDPSVHRCVTDYLARPLRSILHRGRDCMGRFLEDHHSYYLSHDPSCSDLHDSRLLYRLLKQYDELYYGTGEG